ncbi:hypothetical protein [Acidomonas methanolica]|uniref:hypothetical protein n=1 Tax=Acidomonas methanolica TaxID=437 RepID=UPI00211A88A2|nr:hypothetical protein [Acidomonas methanolica]MCQ9154499.1 hypothetical protein [Acidomonas methanolica]
MSLVDGLNTASVAFASAAKGVSTSSAGPENGRVSSGPSRVLDTAAGGEAKANPYRYIDPALNMVVTQFLSPGGVVMAQFPSEKALEQYRLFGAASAGA